MLIRFGVLKDILKNQGITLGYDWFNFDVVDVNIYSNGISFEYELNYRSFERTIDGKLLANEDYASYCQECNIDFYKFYNDLRNMVLFEENLSPNEYGNGSYHPINKGIKCKNEFLRWLSDHFKDLHGELYSTLRNEYGELFSEEYSVIEEYSDYGIAVYTVRREVEIYKRKNTKTQISENVFLFKENYLDK